MVREKTNPIHSLIGKKTPRKDISRVVRKRRYCPGTVALREIVKYQKSTNLLIPKLSFQRLVREITPQVSPFFDEKVSGVKWRSTALLALQEAAESYLIHLFEDSVKCCVHRKCVTLSVDDIRLARDLKNK